MPVVLRSVLLLGGPREAVSSVRNPPPCDACGAALSPRTPVVRVRNRTGPAAVRHVRLCDGCLAAVDRAIDLTDDPHEIDLTPAAG